MTCSYRKTLRRIAILGRRETASPDFNQQRRRFLVTILRREHQRSAPVLHPRMHGCPVVRQHVDHLRFPDQSGEQKRGIKILAVVR